MDREPPPPGHNNPPGPTDIFGPRVNKLLFELTRLSAEEINERIAAQLRDVVKQAIDLKKEMDAAKAVDKQPHLDANTAIEAAYRPLANDTETIRTQARAKIDAFLRSEELRRDREAAEARRIAQEAEEAARAAKLEAVVSAHPGAQEGAEDAESDAAMASHAAIHAEKRAEAGPTVQSASGLGRASSLRSYWSAKVVNPVIAATHFANDPGVKVAVKKAADAFARATKGAQPIPGCEAIEDRRSA